MAETRYQDLSVDDRQDALEVAGRNSDHKAHLLEKDIWVVAVLDVLFDAPFAGHLTLKGGTSLSKAWHAIRRFSEDVDITHDIRAFVPDLVADAGDEALPHTHSQQKRWTRAIRTRLSEWVQYEAGPIVEQGLARAGFVAAVRVGRSGVYRRRGSGGFDLGRRQRVVRLCACHREHRMPEGFAGSVLPGDNGSSRS